MKSVVTFHIGNEEETIVVGEGILDVWASHTTFGSWDIVNEDGKYKIELSCADGTWVYDTMDEAIADVLETVKEWFRKE